MSNRSLEWSWSEVQWLRIISVAVVAVVAVTVVIAVVVVDAVAVVAAVSLTCLRVPMEVWRRRRHLREPEKRSSLFSDVILESFEGIPKSFILQELDQASFYLSWDWALKSFIGSIIPTFTEVLFTDPVFIFVMGSLRWRFPWAISTKYLCRLEIVSLGDFSQIGNSLYQSWYQAKHLT